MNILLLISLFATSLLPGPQCLSEPGNNASFREEPVEFMSDDVRMVGKLYLPEESGRYPGIVMMHGGGGNVERLRATPAFMAEIMVRCGFAVLVYDKRGTGNSGGDYARSDFDDYIEDAGNAGKLLARYDEVNDSSIGIIGFSQGGRLAPVVATRYPYFSFAASVSGPIASISETRLWATKNLFIERGVSEEILEQIMPLWVSHLEAVASGDKDLLNELDAEAAKVDDGYHGALRPPRVGSFPPGGIYNSMGHDYTEELVALDVPWYSLFGGADIIVPVSISTSNIDRIKKQSGNESIMYKIIPGVGHSFSGPDGAFYQFEHDVVVWAMNQAQVDMLHSDYQ